MLIVQSYFTVTPNIHFSTFYARVDANTFSDTL